MKILQYVLRTVDLGITFCGKDNGIEMLAYADSDHATCPDTRRLVSGGAVLLGGAAISWYSRTQEITASGTSESEYVALAEIVKEVLFLRQVQAFIMQTMQSHPITIKKDNEGAIKMANNKFRSRRTRHIDIKHHVVRDAVDPGRWWLPT